MRNYRLFLTDMVHAMNDIESFIFGMDFGAFMTDSKTVSAVSYKLQVIGEAAKQVPDEIKTRYPDVAWKEMAGMRDILIHFYFGTNWRLTWKTITQDVPVAKAQIMVILDDLQSDDTTGIA